MKILFAVSNDNITTSVVNKYQQKYKEIITSKNVYYFNAIIKELQKNRNYDAVVIGEDLEPISNNNYEAIDKFLFEKLDSVSDEAAKSTGEDIPIILICSDRRTQADGLLIKLFGIGIYNAIIGNDRSIDTVCDLINKPRNKKEAKLYYKVETDEISLYEHGNSSDVSETEIQNILAHYRKIGNNPQKCTESFDSIAEQYNETQLRIIIKFLPKEVKSILERSSSRYQKLVNNGTVLSNGKYVSYNKPNEEKKDILTKDLKKTTLSRPVIIPSTINVEKRNEMNNNSSINKDMNQNVVHMPNQNHINNMQPQMPNQNHINNMQPQMSRNNIEGNEHLKMQSESINQNIEKQGLNDMNQMRIENNEINPLGNNLNSKPEFPNNEIINPIGNSFNNYQENTMMPPVNNYQGNAPINNYMGNPMNNSSSNYQGNAPVSNYMESPMDNPSNNYQGNTPVPPINNEMTNQRENSFNNFGTSPIDNMNNIEPINSTVQNVDTTNNNLTNGEQIETVKRGRGRPRKNPESVVPKAVVAYDEFGNPIKRGRGRPRKQDNNAIQGVEPSTMNNNVMPNPTVDNNSMPTQVENSNAIPDTAPAMINNLMPTFEPVTNNETQGNTISQSNNDIFGKEPIKDDTIDLGLFNNGIVNQNDGLQSNSDSNQFNESIFPEVGLDNDLENLFSLDGINNPVTMQENGFAPENNDNMIPGLESNNDSILSGLDNNARPEFEDNSVNTIPGFEDSSINTIPDIEDNSVNTIPGFEDNSVNAIPGFEDNSVNAMPGFEDNSVNAMPGFGDNSVNAIPSFENANNQFQNESLINTNSQPQGISTNNIIAGNGKLVSFVGTSKNGTSFIVNNLAQMLSNSNVKTAILDLTENKNSYYMFTNNDADLMKIAVNSIKELSNGRVNGVNVNRNLSVFTSLPDEQLDVNINTIMHTLSNNFDIILIDCDFETQAECFKISNEIYLVQTMDTFTIQPLTKFLSNLKLKNVLDESKLRIVINKYVRLKKLNEKMIIGGMSKYNEPSMTLQRDLFNSQTIKYTIVPFETETYAKYLENIAMCELNLNGYSSNLINSLEQLKSMVFPLINGANRSVSYAKPTEEKRGLFGSRKQTVVEQPTEQFSSNINNTLNKMRSNNF